MTWPVLLALLLCNAIWSVNPIMGKILLRSYPPYQLAQLRYGATLLTSTVIVLIYRWWRPQRLSPSRDVFSLRNFHWVASIGLITFFGSPILQYLGLIRGSATANSLIVAIEPLFAVLLARAFLGEHLSRKQMFGFFFATTGFLLLSNVKPDRLGESLSLFSIGNLFFLSVMPMEAFYTIASRKLAGRITPVSMFAAALPMGFAVLSAYLWIGHEPLPSLAPLADWHNLLALVVLGPIGTAITYIYWSEVLVDLPVAAVTLTLLGQPMLGAFSGYFFLGEHLDLWQGLGAVLILGALALQVLQKGES